MTEDSEIGLRLFDQTLLVGTDIARYLNSKT